MANRKPSGMPSVRSSRKPSSNFSHSGSAIASGVGGSGSGSGSETSIAPFTLLASLTKLNDFSVSVATTLKTSSSSHRTSRFFSRSDHNPSPGQHPTGNTLETFRTAAQQRNLDALKEMLRSLHWPAIHTSRRTLWAELVNLFASDESYTYRDATSKLNNVPTLPGFASNAHTQTFCLRPTGVQAVYRLLAVVQLYHPHVTACPMLFPLTSILLHYLTEEIAYSALSALLANQPRGLNQRFKSKPPDGSKHRLDWIIQTQQGYEVSTLTLRHLVKKYVPAAFSFVKSVLGEKDVFGFYEDWIWWVIEQLPLDHVVRVIDCYLLEGIKIFYRVAIVLIRSFHHHAKEEKMTYSSHSELCGAMRKHCQAGSSFSADELLLQAFKLRGFSKAQLLRYYARFDDTIDDYRTFRMSRIADSELSPGSATHRDTLSNFGGVVAPLVPEYATELHSSLLTTDLLRIVWSWLPERMQLNRPFVVYSTDEHGYNLHTLYAKCEEYEPTILLVRSAGGSLFGAYCSTAWSEREVRDNRDNRLSSVHKRHSARQQPVTFFGTGESFVFKLVPQSRVYRWVGVSHVAEATTNNNRHSMRHKEAPHAFQLGLRESISIGGYGREAALFLEESLTTGTSRRSTTFNNECLAEDDDFNCVAVEVIALERY